MLTLEIKTRDGQIGVDAVRASGMVPAVCYGPKEAALAIMIDASRARSVIKEAGETTMISLTGAGTPKAALVRDVQFDPVYGHIIHIDFYIPEKGKKITVEVPLVFEGVAPAEKLGFQVAKTLHEIEIEVAVEDLPQTLPVDISVLANDGDQIIASQIVLPKSAVLLTDPDEIVASVTEAKEEVVQAPVAEAPAAEPVKDTAKKDPSKRESK